MVDGIGRSDIARAAIEAALKSQAELARKIEAQVAPNAAPGVESARSTFEASLASTLSRVEQSARAVEQLPADLVTGQVGDFHEVIGRLKQSELTFKFALEVRNKLIDAYRETMRMSV